MDTRYGKYSGPLAALTERWILDGDFGDEEFSDSDLGEGTIMWRGLHSLTWDDAMYLRAEFDCDDEELSLLSKEIGGAQGIVHAWDSQGFVYANTLDTMAELHEQVALIHTANEAFPEEES